MHILARTSAFTLTALALATVVAPRNGWSAELTAAQCDTDRQELLADIEKIRQDAVKYYDEAIAEIIDPDARNQLGVERQRVFDHEEQQRQTAYIIWRECMAHVEKAAAEKTKTKKAE